MTEHTVTLEHHDGLGVITLDRPSRRNALHGPMWSAVAERVAEARELGLRALILTGAGEHFSAGMDLKPDNPLIGRILPAVTQGDREAARALILELKAVGRGLLDFPAPTFCAMEGACLGGGYELALHCDVLVATTTTRVGLPEARMGMVPDVGGTTLLARRVGRGRAVLAVSTGRSFEGAEALALGMVDVVVAPGQALATAKALGAEVILGAPVAVAGAVAVARRAHDLPLDEAFAEETEAGIDALVSGQPLEGLAAFAQRRPPRW